MRGVASNPLARCCGAAVIIQLLSGVRVYKRPYSTGTVEEYLAVEIRREAFLRCFSLRAEIEKRPKNLAVCPLFQAPSSFFFQSFGKDLFILFLNLRILL